VCLRLYTRWSHLHTITKSDWIILAAYCTFCVTVAIDTLSSAEGFFSKDVTYNSDLSQVIYNTKELTKLLKVSPLILFLLTSTAFSSTRFYMSDLFIYNRHDVQRIVYMYQLYTNRYLFSYSSFPLFHISSHFIS